MPWWLLSLLLLSAYACGKRDYPAPSPPAERPASDEARRAASPERPLGEHPQAIDGEVSAPSVDQGMELRLVLALPQSEGSAEVAAKVVKGAQLAQKYAQVSACNGSAEVAVKLSAVDEDQVDFGALFREQEQYALLGGLTQRGARRLAQEASQADHPVLVMNPWVEISSKDGWVFRSFFSFRGEVDAIVAASQHLGVGRLGVLGPASAYSRLVLRTIQDNVSPGQNLRSVALVYEPNAEQPLKAVDKMLRQHVPDGLLIAAHASDIEVIAPFLSAQGWKSTDLRKVRRADRPQPRRRQTQLFLPSLSWSDALLAETGKYLEGAQVFLPFDAVAQNQAAQDFVSLYESEFGEVPDLFAAASFDSVRLLAGAWASREGTRPKDLSAALRSMPACPTATVFGGFAASGEPRRHAVMTTVRNGLRTHPDE